LTSASKEGIIHAATVDDGRGLIKVGGKVNVSIGTAGVLGLDKVRMDVAPTTAYLMVGGRCRMDCAFCAQARSSSASALKLSRVTWPPFEEKEVLDRLAEAEVKGTIRRVCLQVTVGRDYFRRTLELVQAIKGICHLPVDASVLPGDLRQVEALLAAGLDHIGFGLDAACERVFKRVKGGDWRHSLALIEETAEHFPGHVAVHLIVGLGETEREMAEAIQRMHDLGAVVALFAFTPVWGTAMENVPPPPLPTYRRMQAVRHLIVHGLARFEDLAFDGGRLVSFNISNLGELLADGEAFRTSGCPDCNRPFYNERPSGTMYNYPRPLSPAEVEAAIAELKLGEI